MNAAADTSLRVELVYAEPAQQVLVTLSVPPGTTALHALTESSLPTDFPDVDFTQCVLGIWGRTVDGQHALRDGDRLEVYRPLLMDPREARRQLALHGRAMGQKDRDED